MNKQLKILFIYVLFGVEALSLKATDVSNIVILDEAGVRNLGLQTVEAEEIPFESTVFAIGRIEEIPSNRSVLSSRIAGRIAELYAFEGDTVKAGDPIARVESRQLGDPPPSITLKAPQAGIIIQSHVRLGQPVEPDIELLDISDRSKIWAVAKIPEQEAASVSIGTKAHIHIPALGSERIDARLMRFGVFADRQAGTVEGIFEIENVEGKLRPGLRAEFSIVLKTREHVLAIPRQAIQGNPSNRIVFIRDFDLPNAFLRMPVIVGEQNQQFVEIVSGLFPGDEVVTQGAYSLGFAGGSNRMSLKEALDAAHGHEHNEDGSEITAEQKAAREAAKKTDNTPNSHAHETAVWNSPTGLYAIAITGLFIIVTQLLWKKSKQLKVIAATANSDA